MYIDNTNKLVNFFDSLPEKFLIPKSYIVTHNNCKFQNSNDVNCGWLLVVFIIFMFVT